MRGVAAVLVLGLFSVGAGPKSASRFPSAPRLSTQSCGTTRVQSDDRAPAWTATARPPAAVPYALSTRRNVAAILFGSPLRSGHPADHSNKILWIMRESRNSQPLRLRARPLHHASPTVQLVRAADSTPGEIYPSIVDVPRPGCWEFRLAWNGHRAVIDLRYR